jgi:hypothetical protein
MLPEQERIEAIGEQLRAKIASKFTASSFLAGFGLTVLTGQVFALWQAEQLSPLFPAAVGAVFGAFVLFIEAIVRLDELTMPKRFWAESKDVAPPPQVPLGGSYLTDDDNWELQKRMIFYWVHLTVTATVITGVAVLAMLFPWWTIRSDDARLWSFGCAVVGVVIAREYRCWLERRAAKQFKPQVRPVD